MSAVRVLLIFPGSLYGGDWAAGPRVKPELVGSFDFLRRQGHDVDVVDLEAELGNPSDDDQRQLFLAKACTLLGGRDPQLVAIHCRTSLQYTASIVVAEDVRRLYPQAVIAVTGFHLAARPEDFTYEGSPMNWVLVGDPETALAQVAAVIDAGDHDTESCRALEGTPLRLSEMAAPDYGAYPYTARGLPDLSVYLSRGCPFHTAACMLRPGGHGWVAYAPAITLGLLDELASFAPHQIEVLDPAFGFDSAWRSTVLDELAKTYRRAVPLTICGRPDTLTRRDLDRIYQASMRLRLSVETLSRELLSRTAAAPDPQRAVEQALDLLGYASAKGIPTTVYFAFNQPGETRATAAETLDRLRTFTQSQPNTSLQLRADSWAYFPTSEPAADLAAPAERFGTRIAYDGWWREQIASESAAKAIVASSDLADLPPGDDSYWRPQFDDLRREFEDKLTAAARLGLRSHESVGSAATDVPHGWWVEGRWH